VATSSGFPKRGIGVVRLGYGGKPSLRFDRAIVEVGTTLTMAPFELGSAIRDPMSSTGGNVYPS
jgi:hypothetical protein